MWLPCCWTTRLSCQRLTSGTIDATLQQFAPLGDILQGTVATHLRCGRICSDKIITNPPDSVSETILKIA